MDNAVLRPLRHSDAVSVQGWLNRYLSEHMARWTEAYASPPESSLEELVLRDWHRLLEASSSDARFAQVLETTSPVGIVLARKQIEGYMGFEVGVLDWIYVDTDLRGQGAADELMNSATSWMREQGVKGRQVYVTIDNAAAVRLYERHGFKSVDTRMLAK